MRPQWDGFRREASGTRDRVRRTVSQFAGGTVMGRVCVASALLYALVVTNLQAYGVVRAGVAIRLSDVFAMWLVGVCCLRWLLGDVRVQHPGMAVWLLPFVFLEFALPLLGAWFYGELHEVSSSLRAVLIWAPALACVCLLTSTEGKVFRDGFLLVLGAGIVIQGLLAASQAASALNYLPDPLQLRERLLDYAVDPHYRVRAGARAMSLQTNANAFATYASLSLVILLAAAVRKPTMLRIALALTAIGCVLLSASRSGIASVCLILVIAPVLARGSKRLAAGLTIALAVTFVSATAIYLEGSDLLFERFTRLESGLRTDSSALARAEIAWPYVIESARQWPVGTLTHPVDKFGLIDSGYLTFYAQGKWLFLAALVCLFWGLIRSGATHYMRRQRDASLVSIGVLIFLAISLIVMNPLRSPIVAIFVTLALSQPIARKREGLASRWGADRGGLRGEGPATS